MFGSVDYTWSSFSLRQSQNSEALQFVLWTLSFPWLWVNHHHCHPSWSGYLVAGGGLGQIALLKPFLPYADNLTIFWVRRALKCEVLCPCFSYVSPAISLWHRCDYYNYYYRGGNWGLENFCDLCHIPEGGEVEGYDSRVPSQPLCLVLQLGINCLGGGRLPPRGWNVWPCPAQGNNSYIRIAVVMVSILLWVRLLLVPVIATQIKLRTIFKI